MLVLGLDNFLDYRVPLLARWAAPHPLGGLVATVLAEICRFDLRQGRFMFIERKLIKIEISPKTKAQARGRAGLLF
jgi:hypothetical protein